MLKIYKTAIEQINSHFVRIKGKREEEMRTVWFQQWNRIDVIERVAEMLENSRCGSSDGDVEAEVAGRGAAGLVKSGTIVIGNDYEYAYAA